MLKATKTTDSKRLFHFTDANFKSEVLESAQPVLVDFWAAWCEPCHAIAQTIGELADRYDGSIKVGKLEVDDNLKTARAYGISSIPTVLVFKNGEVIGSAVGVQPRERYEQLLNQVAEAA